MKLCLAEAGPRLLLRHRRQAARHQLRAGHHLRELQVRLGIYLLIIFALKSHYFGFLKSVKDLFVCKCDYGGLTSLTGVPQVGGCVQRLGLGSGEAQPREPAVLRPAAGGPTRDERGLAAPGPADEQRGPARGVEHAGQPGTLTTLLCGHNKMLPRFCLS